MIENVLLAKPKKSREALLPHCRDKRVDTITQRGYFLETKAKSTDADVVYNALESGLSTTQATMLVNHFLKLIQGTSAKVHGGNKCNKSVSQQGGG